MRNGKPVHKYYHTLYLAERTESELSRRIAEKLLVEPDQIRIIWVTPKGMKVIVDDGMVEQFLEGQTLSADISDLSRNEECSDTKVFPIEVRLMFSVY